MVSHRRPGYGNVLPFLKQNRRHETMPTEKHRNEFASVNACSGLCLHVKVACSESLVPEQFSLPSGRRIVKSCSLLFYFFRSSAALGIRWILLGNRIEYSTSRGRCQYPLSIILLKRNDHPFKIDIPESNIPPTLQRTT